MAEVAAVFGTTQAAEQARQSLIDAGVSPIRITLSQSMTQDDIAAEYPGQSYENQPGQDTSALARRLMQHHESARSAVCVLTVDVETADAAAAVDQSMRRAGARSTFRRGV